MQGFSGLPSILRGLPHSETVPLSLTTAPAIGSPDQRGSSRMRRREFIAAASRRTFSLKWLPLQRAGKIGSEPAAQSLRSTHSADPTGIVRRAGIPPLS
jgi:hypothetical protein